MKMKFRMQLLLAFFSALLVTGCVTHRINWDGRIGNYSYDQAIVDLGPPDKTARLSDGKTVAEWITRYSSAGTVMVGGGGFYRHGGIGWVETSPTYFESKLRLTFTTNNVLAAWSRD